MRQQKSSEWSQAAGGRGASTPNLHLGARIRQCPTSAAPHIRLWQGTFMSASDLRSLSVLRNTERCINYTTDPVQVQSMETHGASKAHVWVGTKPGQVMGRRAPLPSAPTHNPSCSHRTHKLMVSTPGCNMHALCMSCEAAPQALGRRRTPRLIERIWTMRRQRTPGLKAAPPPPPRRCRRQRPRQRKALPYRPRHRHRRPARD